MSRFPSNVRFEYREAHPSNWTAGSWSKDFIVLHWWDNPAKRPQFDGVVSWFRNPSANVSIQYVVESGRITQMIPESAQAWHAGNRTANRHGIGIEVNPRLSDGDYETTAVLVAEIWKRRGKKLPLRRHREFTTTNCPGTLDVARVRRRAEQIYSGKTTTAGGTKTVAYNWPSRLKSHITGAQLTPGNMLRDAQRKAHQASRLWMQREKPLASLTDSYSSIRKDGYTFRAWLQYAYVWARRANGRALEARNEVREVKAMVKALAKAQDELQKGQGKILRAVEDAEREVIKANAAEVAAELEVSVKEDD